MIFFCFCKAHRHHDVHPHDDSANLRSELEREKEVERGLRGELKHEQDVEHIKNQEIETLKMELATLEITAETQKSEIKALREENKALSLKQQQFAAVQEELASIQATLSEQPKSQEHIDALAVAREREEEMKKSADQEHEEITRLRSQIDTETKENAVLAANNNLLLQSQQDQKTLHDETIKKLREENADLQGQIEKAKKSNQQEFEEEIARIRTEADQAIKEKNEEAEALREERDRLKDIEQELARMTKLKEESDAEYTKLKANFDFQAIDLQNDEREIAFDKQQMQKMEVFLNFLFFSVF